MGAIDQTGSPSQNVAGLTSDIEGAVTIDRLSQRRFCGGGPCSNGEFRVVFLGVMEQGGEVNNGSKNP